MTDDNREVVNKLNEVLDNRIMDLALSYLPVRNKYNKHHHKNKKTQLAYLESLYINNSEFRSSIDSLEEDRAILLQAVQANYIYNITGVMMLIENYYVFYDSMEVGLRGNSVYNI